ncbi:RING finger protein 10 isoform X1 [Canna indica]|uniref:RING finger protein 10 isoform X1 n=1 Tax=Canna indica TaxID=4628 RepID=A0AAQ3QG03_9LILI|nr:RING finger protein 10 isoform X1 [Canna indica]
MSISPTDAQQSAASPALSSPNPCATHGTCQDPCGPSDPRAEGLPSAGSVPSSSSEHRGPAPSGNSESTSFTGGNYHNSSKKVIKSRTSGNRKGPHGQKRGTNFECQSNGWKEAPLHCQFDQFEHAQGKERPSVNASFMHPENLTGGPSGPQGTASQSAMRRSNVINANHLLNFYYDPISRPEPRVPPPRRQRKIKPYNKDLFLQANYKFVVLDRGGYEFESVDPDKMLNWEDVIFVRYSTPFMVQCPICLETPLCPQITTCGHIYCFPCILRYLLMGEENHKGECWKKCPLCFMMISTKDLYTVLIENVKHFNVGDQAHFTLLSRPKDSVFPAPKNKQVESSISCSTGGLCDSFSKFVLTSDVELSVREAKSDLEFWLHKADSGVVDDLEKLPYVCAALEQLEERMKMWGVQHTYSTSPPIRDHASHSVCAKASHSSKMRDLHALSLSSFGSSRSYTDEPGTGAPNCVPGHTGSSIISGSDRPLSPVDAKDEQLENSKKVSSSHNVDKSFEQEDKSSLQYSRGYGVTEKDSYTFYQATDGQHLILHPLNMKCLLHHYGSYDMLPPSISGEILELESVTQSEAMRKRYRYLSHFSLTTTFQLCEIELRHLLPPSSLAPFMDEIKKREKQRQRLVRKEKDERARAEAALNLNFIPSRRHLSHKDVVFSSDDFEALGTNNMPSTSPPSSERKLFSDVARLGYAAAHDSPSLRVEEAADSPGDVGKASNVLAPRNMTTLSFATILSSDREVDNTEQQINSIGKKGKKPNRVLLSTSGGRRY